MIEQSTVHIYHDGSHFIGTIIYLRELFLALCFISFSFPKIIDSHQTNATMMNVHQTSPIYIYELSSGAYAMHSNYCR